MGGSTRTVTQDGSGDEEQAKRVGSVNIWTMNGQKQKQEQQQEQVLYQRSIGQRNSPKRSATDGAGPPPHHYQHHTMGIDMDMELEMGMSMGMGIGINRSRGMPISRSSTNLQSLANDNDVHSDVHNGLTINNRNAIREQDPVLSSSWSSSWASHALPRG